MASQVMTQGFTMFVCFNLLVDMSVVVEAQTVEDYCPDNGKAHHGNWIYDEKDKLSRCILKCHHGYEPTGCHVIRKDGYGEWNFGIPECKKADWISKKKIACYAAAGSLIVSSPYLLSLLGFTGVGIAAGSVAAWIMKMGLFTKGSFFAWLQSLGMKGIGKEAMTFIIANIGSACDGIIPDSLFKDCEEE